MNLSFEKLSSIQKCEIIFWKDEFNIKCFNVKLQFVLTKKKFSIKYKIVFWKDRFNIKSEFVFWKDEFSTKIKEVLKSVVFFYLFFK